MTAKEAAVKYVTVYGFSVIPCKKDKKPLWEALPLNPDTGKPTWEPFQHRKPTEEEIEEWWGKWPSANIGIVTGSISNLAVIDLDGPEGMQSADKFNLCTPTVYTPGGGMHLYYRYRDGIGNAARIMPGVDVRGEGGYVLAPPSVNDVGAAYTYMSSMGLANTPLADFPDLKEKKEKKETFPPHTPPIKKEKKEEKAKTDKDANAFGRRICLEQGTRDESLFTIANALIKAKVDEKDVRQVLDIISKSCRPPFPEHEATTKIRSAIERAQRRERPLQAEVREYVLSSSGIFLSSDVIKSLQVSSKDEQKLISNALGRMVDEGLIERNGKRNGQFRRIETNYDEIDIMGADMTPLPILWPFELEKVFNTMPKNIIIVAGEPDSGKTAFLLNFAKLNMYEQEVAYFSSEMGAQELKSRLVMFDTPLEDFQKVTWIERNTNFADLIRPNAINIIDFMEIHDQFWIIGQWILEVFDRLENGIAVIALQKGIGKEIGRGGDITLEKPRLYLTMQPGKIKIRKCKNWANPMINPNYKFKTFKLVGGCKFISGWDWMVEEEKKDG